MIISRGRLNMIKFEDVKNITTKEYFKNNQFSIDAFNKKYQLNDNESYVEALKRVCEYIASAEKTEKLQKYWSERWFDEIYNDFWHPAGSIMQGANNPNKISLMNCTTIAMPEDSLESIFKYNALNVAKSAAYRQGLGVDFSKIRPKGMRVNNSANQSEGALHWMKFIDSIGYYVGQKGRIPAMLFSLNIKHPDILDFIKVKSDYTKIQNANISIQITNGFYKAIENNEDWELKFEVPATKKGDKCYLNPDFDNIKLADGKDEQGYFKYYKFDRKKEVLNKKVNAKELLELIAKNMYNNGEPGVQNIDLARKYSNSDPLGFNIISTNACCLEENTKILTNNGWLTIAEIHKRFQNNEKISTLSYNIINDVFENKEIIDSFQKRNDYTILLKIKYNNTTTYVECSLDHPILTKNKGYVKAVELTDKDYIIVFNSSGVSGELIEKTILNEIKPLYDIEVKDNHNFVINGGIVVKNSEQYLDNGGLCCLSSLNCEKFYNEQTQYNKEKLNEIVLSMNRFLDNTIEKELQDNRYASFDQKRSLESLRRNGIGVTNIAGLLFLNNFEYGNENGNKLIEVFMDDLNYFAYVSSIKLGEEKGSFKAFDKAKYLESGFIKQLIKKHPDLDFKTMRSCNLTSVAPSGTLSLMFSNSLLSYGIEPPFGMYYWKRTRISGKYEYYFVVPNAVRVLFEKHGYKIPIESDTITDTWDGALGNPIAKFIEENKDKIGIKFKCATDINYKNKLDLMARVQSSVDSSMSVTYMLPENSTWKDVYNLILDAYNKDVKSIAAFPDKKMYGIISFIPFKELAFNLKNEGKNLHPQNFTEEELKELNIAKENIELTKFHVPKRLETIDADIYSIIVKGEKFIIAVGIQNGQPYEIFGGHMNGFGIKNKHIKGTITKVTKGVYSLSFGDIIIDNFSTQFTPTEKILFRMLSLQLRGGITISDIVEQLQKATDDITSLASAVARVLKKYIQDGQKIIGQTCPTCNKSDSLFYHDGCVTCACGWSKCS